jgi:uncharacterized membrane protein
MTQSLISRALIASTFVAAVSSFPATSIAQEGAQSVGKGLKCYTAGFVNANGTVSYQRVCYKSI